MKGKNYDLFETKPLKHITPPGVYINAETIIKITDETKLIHYIETGGALIGLKIPRVSENQEPAEPNIYIFDTIFPDESAIRKYASFKLGDCAQEKVFLKLAENWDKERKNGRISKKLNYPWTVPHILRTYSVDFC